MSSIEQSQVDFTDPNKELMSIAEVAGFPTAEPVELPDEFILPEKSELTPYEVWVMNPTKDNLYDVTESLQPTINAVLASFGSKDPNIRTKARIAAAKAVQSYDPARGVSLATWTTQQLRPLGRAIRESNSTLSIPEGIQLDAFTLNRHSKELEEELGREPTVEELADRSSISIKRIKDIRKKLRAESTESAFTQDDGSSMLKGFAIDNSQEAMDYVYSDSDTVDKKLMEYTVGYGGSDVLDSKTIMKKLNLTPVQLTRRKMRLSKRIHDLIQDLDTM